MESLQTASLALPPRETVQSLQKPGVILEVATQVLQKFGGFDLLVSAIEGVQNISPDKKARRDMFLGEAVWKSERQALEQTLQLWVDILENGEDLGDMVARSQEGFGRADHLLKNNLKTAIDQTRDLERSYRSVAMFFSNTESVKVKNVSFMNVELEQLADLDNPRFIESIQKELADNYDRLDLRNNYSLLVIPGYLGSNKVVEKWGKIAHENKVLLITDFRDFAGPDDVMELFEAANLTGGEIFRSNVVMTCNWLVGRGRFNMAGEEEDLFVPPSAALAGKIYNTLMSQITAGKKHGAINEVDGVRFDLKKSEIADLEKLGLLPMVKEYGKVMSFSGKTLFNGDNLGLQTYSVVRVFDYVAKVMMDFLNRRTFENFTAHTKEELRYEIIRFLDSISGYNKLIENFSIKRFEKDPLQKDKIYLDIHMTPFFPAKTYMIKLEGQKGDDGKNDWSSEYEQKAK